jgi:hypothetical protein
MAQGGSMDRETPRTENTHSNRLDQIMSVFVHRVKDGVKEGIQVVEWFYEKPEAREGWRVTECPIEGEPTKWSRDKVFYFEQYNKGIFFQDESGQAIFVPSGAILIPGDATTIEVAKE